MKNKEAILNKCHSKVFYANVLTHGCHYFSYFTRTVFYVLISEFEGRRYLLLNFLVIIADIVSLLFGMDWRQ